MQDHRM